MGDFCAQNGHTPDYDRATLELHESDTGEEVLVLIPCVECRATAMKVLSTETFAGLQWTPTREQVEAHLAAKLAVDHTKCVVVNLVDWVWSCEAGR